MTKIVNLTRFRKKKARAEKENQAEKNRAKFGRTKAEKARDEQQRKALERHLDAHKTGDADDAAALWDYAMAKESRAHQVTSLPGLFSDHRRET